MPSVKMTEIIELADRNIADLRAGDPAWTAAQKRRAKNAIEMMKAFNVLTAEACSDAVQTIPTWPGVRKQTVRIAITNTPARRSASRT